MHHQASSSPHALAGAALPQFDAISCCLATSPACMAACTLEQQAVQGRCLKQKRRAGCAAGPLPPRPACCPACCFVCCCCHPFTSVCCSRCCSVSCCCGCCCWSWSWCCKCCCRDCCCGCCWRRLAEPMGAMFKWFGTGLAVGKPLCAHRAPAPDAMQHL